MPIDFSYINLSYFHLLRPELLWLIVPAFLALYGVKHLAKKQSSWHNVISPHLLKFLMISAEKQRSHVSFWLTAIIATLIIFAVSGPSFRQKTVPVFQSETSRVVLLDLSLSMDATDIKPSRITRAKHKMMDFLNQTNEGTIGLVVYAGDAFVISPLTSDANTIASMVPTLSTGVMPVLGSRPDKGINKAIQLLDNAKQTRGQIIWITDGIDKEYINAIKEMITSSDHFLSILAVGTEQGAPIPLPDNNGFLKDSAGNIILPKLESQNLKQVTRAVNGQYVELTANSDDIDFIVETLLKDDDASQSDERISKWIDDGYWFSWFILVFMFFKLFRRTGGELMNFSAVGISLMFISFFIPQNANANIWDDLWKTKDQQASKAFTEKDFKKASELFEDKKWQGAANYREGKFDAAVLQFENKDDIESLYNKANSLAKAQSFQKSLDSYNKVLEQNPTHEDSLFNKKIVEELLKKQQEQEKKGQEKKDQEEKEQQESDDKSDPDSDSDEKPDQESEEKSDEEKKKEQEEQKKQEQSDKESEQQEKEQEAQISEDEREQNEKDQALEHWLEKIPDDPGGLLRRKMYREYQKRNRQQTEKKIW